MLRFGWPNIWHRLGSRNLEGGAESSRLNFGVYLTWQFQYRLNDLQTVQDRRIIFQDMGGRTRFTARDSLKGPDWPPFW